MRFYAKYEVPHLANLGIIMNYIEMVAEKEMKIGVQLFFEQLLIRIPVLTGFLRGSFTNVAQQFNVSDTVVGINTRPMFYNKSILKTPTSGQPYTTAVFKKEGNLIVFDIKTEIEYMSINDFNSRGRGTPWGATEAAKNAFIKYMESFPERFPVLEKVLSVVSITLTDRTLSRVVKGM